MIYKPKFNLKDTVYIDRKFSSLSSSFFKPIVATSLLFLLPSLGMGDDYQVSGDGPTIKVTSTESSADSHLSWDNACSGSSSANNCSTTASATWTESGGAWTGTFSDKNITNLVLRFDNNNILTNSASSVYLYTGSSTYEAYINAYGAKASVITADFDGKSLGTEDNKINLDLRFASGLTGTKTITVKDLNTLNGNLTIGYAISSSDTTKDIYKYDISVDTINGNLTLYGSNYVLNGTVNIKSALNGSIYLTADSSPGPKVGTTSDTAALTVNFGENATMTGDIADKSNGSGGLRKDIKFAGSGVVLTGNIVSFGTTSLTNDYFNTSAGNRVYFTQGSMTGYIIASTGQVGSSGTNVVDKKGLNVVVFGDTNSTTTHTLTGGILASDIKAMSASDTNAQQATNVIVLADSTTLNINADSSNSGTLNGSFANGAITGSGDNGNDKSSTTFSVTSGSINLNSI